MKIENILELETGNEDQIHHRLVAKVGQELIWLGFPKNVLPVLEKESLSRLWSFRVVSEDHILIQGFPAVGDFETWKGTVLSALQKAENPADSVISWPMIS